MVGPRRHGVLPGPGSIVALGAGLAILQKGIRHERWRGGSAGRHRPQCLGCALGALIGGWLGDKLGRKRIYQYDLLVLRGWHSVYRFGV